MPPVIRGGWPRYAHQAAAFESTMPGRAGGRGGSGDRSELHVIPRGLEVQGHRGDLARVLDNLLANALVHTEPGTPVWMAARRRSGRVVVDVADEGPGLSPEDASRAFDRFYRAEPSRARPGGSGTGLAIVQAVVEAHEGTVELDTAPRRGRDLHRRATGRLSWPASPDSTGRPAPGAPEGEDPRGRNLSVSRVSVACRMHFADRA